MDIRSKISLESAAARALVNGKEQIVVLDCDDCNLNEISVFASRQKFVRASVELGEQHDERRWRVTMHAL